MTTIKHHPDNTLIRAYAEGTLAPSVSLLLSAHLEYCPKCRAAVQQMEMQLSDSVVSAESRGQDSATTDRLLAKLLRDLPEIDESSQGNEVMAGSTGEMGSISDLPELTLENRRFVLPQVFAKQLHKASAWSRLPGRLHQARLGIDNSHIHFIHMDRDSQVPPHTHRGTEHTLVVHGGFADERGDYRIGDFVTLDGRHTHQPHTDDVEDCLVISALDAPLQFTSGLARMLNPLSGLFFR
ncbi:ChrR family anti-sigma-E factor [Ferrimonas gelatinilytica]|uniref:ChrR family anti-sigma-E factor n=1 Tax=Ferrimonas gelatinilytica TaxID=1255257 RepID=A0ABP9S364_9GAMM